MKNLYETQAMLHTIGQKYQRYLLPKEGPISFQQFHFLMFLQRKVSCTPSEIAKQFDITMGAVTGFVDRLYKLNLITRERSEQDRRLVVIELSEEGKNQLANFEKRLFEVHQQIKQRLGEQEIELLNQHLARYQQVLLEIVED